MNSILFFFLFVFSLELGLYAVTANFTHRYFFFPGDDGKIHLVDSKAPINKTQIKLFSRDCNNYWLYTRSNPKSKQVLKFGDKESVKRSHFNSRKVTVITAHGWKGNGNTEMNVLLTKVFLKQGDVNVIVLDWSKLAKADYVAAKTAVPMVGKQLGQFVHWLKIFGMPLNKVHLVGHSLGGHLVGNAGKALRGQANRITALDPAGPLWYRDDSYRLYRVTSTDARYVEIIHTNAFMAGYPFPSGHSDYYPNGGSFMPGCLISDLSCHHARSWKYMAASVEFNGLNANKCNESWHFIFDMCNGPFSSMGNNNINKKQFGVYRVNTKREYPYGYSVAQKRKPGY